MIVVAVIGSSPAVGESYSTSFGSVTTARAIPTRRRMPPDNSLGNCSIVCSSSTKRSASRTACSVFELVVTRFARQLVQQRIGNVLLYRHRIEQAALLEQDAYPATQFVQVVLGGLRDVLPEQRYSPRVCLLQAHRRLQQYGFPATGGAQQDARFSGANFKRNLIERRFLVESNRDILEAEDDLPDPRCAPVALAVCRPCPFTNSQKCGQ